MRNVALAEVFYFIFYIYIIFNIILGRDIVFL